MALPDFFGWASLVVEGGEVSLDKDCSLPQWRAASQVRLEPGLFPLHLSSVLTQVCLTTSKGWDCHIENLFFTEADHT